MAASKLTGWVVPALIVGVLLLGFLLFWGGDIMVYWRNSQISVPFKDREAILYSEAYKIIEASGGDQKGAPKDPCRAGKCVFIYVLSRVNRSSNELEISLDSDFGRLPDELRAAKPEEVRTVVILRPESRKVIDINYTPIGKDMVHRTRREKGRVSLLDVQLVDLKKQRYIGRKVFEWPEDDDIGVSYAKRDSQEFLEWYKSLTDRQ